QISLEACDTRPLTAGVLAAGGHGDQSHVLALCLLAQRLRERIAIQVQQIELEQNEARLKGRCDGQRSVARVRNASLRVTRCTQSQLQRARRTDIVIYDEDPYG